MNRLHSLATHGQAIWLDNIDRRLLESHGLRRLVDDDGLRGVTSNPSIFQKAITSGSEYDRAIAALLLASPDISTQELYEELAVADIREATDVLRPVWDQTRGEDGYVSLEVSPHLAHDTQGTIEEARRLWRMVDRPNLMIKVPATPEGIPAVETLLAEGHNVNVTLMFSLAHYEQVAGAYLRALRRRADPAGVASVASFFVSRVDTRVDAQLEEIGTSEALALRGQAAIANARLAYARFMELFEGEDFEELRSQGARPQRPLWASTSTKNPSYRDVLYVEELVGLDTVNTLPPATLDAFRDHGEAREALRSEIDGARRVLEALARVGIDLDQVTEDLQKAGVEAFAKSFDALLADLDAKRRGLDIPELDPGSFRLGSYEKRVSARLESWHRDCFAERLWQRDPTLWGPADTPELADRLGWLQLPVSQQGQGEELRQLVAEIRADGIRRVVLLGMGGSSLAPEVFQATFGTAEGHPVLEVLDTTHPDAVRAVEERLVPAETLFVVASKSGTTLESLSLMRYFLHFMEAAVPNPGRHFVAITDPGSQLEEEATSRPFRALYLAPPDVGGRFSALSPFGLVPAALVGAPVDQLLDRAMEMSVACSATVPEARNPALRLGAALAELALAGRDKLTFLPSEAFAAFPAWIEQLVAESTGKNGKGILPVDEAAGDETSYGEDRVFVTLGQADEAERDLLDRLAAAGNPVLEIAPREADDLGAEMFRWELAVAAAGAALAIQPFDQPDVQIAKELAKKALDAPAVTPAELDANDAVGLARRLEGFLGGSEDGDYVALLAYLAPSAATTQALRRIQSALRTRTGRAVTVGYGPRYLHSTGQLHKGGKNNGLFLQLVDEPANEVPVPGMETSFARILAAQSIGDFRALEERQRRVLRLQLGRDVEAGLAHLLSAIG